MGARRTLRLKRRRDGNSQAIEVNVPEQVNFRYHPKSSWPGGGKEPLAVNVQRSNAFVVVLGRFTVSKLLIEAVCDGSKRLGLVTTKSNVHIERQSVVVTVFRNLASGTCEMMQFRFEQEGLPRDYGSLCVGALRPALRPNGTC